MFVHSRCPHLTRLLVSAIDVANLDADLELALFILPRFFTSFVPRDDSLPADAFAAIHSSFIVFGKLRRVDDSGALIVGGVNFILLQNH